MEEKNLYNDGGCHTTKRISKISGDEVTT